jgi:hypothetical protein
VAHIAGHYTVAVWGSVGIVHWVRQADLTAMKHVHRSLRRLVDEHPSGVSFIHVIEDGAGLPSAEARGELSTMMAGFADATVCVAVVLLGGGFWASALQSLLTGLRLVAPPRRWTLRFATNTADLRNWLPRLHVERTHHYIDARALDQVIARVMTMGAAVNDLAHGS